MKLILSVGGSLISKKDGIDHAFVKSLVKKLVELKKNYDIIAFVGGGSLAREYIKSAKKIGVKENKKLDIIGIKVTQLNAELIRTSLGKHAFPKVVSNPEKIITSKKIIICSGWKPGWSTDYDAVIAAKKQNVHRVINLTNIDYVYDKDPNKYQNAKPIKNMMWDDMLKIISKFKWKPGLNLPFDPRASIFAQKNRIEVIIINGKKLNELQKYLNGKDFRGTRIY